VSASARSTASGAAMFRFTRTWASWFGSLLKQKVPSGVPTAGQVRFQNLGDWAFSTRCRCRVLVAWGDQGRVERLVVEIAHGQRRRPGPMDLQRPFVEVAQGLTGDCPVRSGHRLLV
jgi:hypothetical protein